MARVARTPPLLTRWRQFSRAVQEQDATRAASCSGPPVGVAQRDLAFSRTDWPSFRAAARRLRPVHASIAPRRWAARPQPRETGRRVHIVHVIAAVARATCVAKHGAPSPRTALREMAGSKRCVGFSSLSEDRSAIAESGGRMGWLGPRSSACEGRFPPRMPIVFRPPCGIVAAAGFGKGIGGNGRALTSRASPASFFARTECSPRTMPTVRYKPVLKIAEQERSKRWIPRSRKPHYA